MHVRALVAVLLIAQGPPVRVDFEGSLSKAAAPAPAPSRVAGAPVRVDFEGSQSKADAPSAGTGARARAAAGPPLRADFEGSLARSGSATASPSERQSGQPQQRQPAQPAAKENQPRQQQPAQGNAAGPTITGLQPRCLRPGAPLTIVGRGFGQAAGNRRLVLTGPSTIALAVSSWSDTSIAALVPPNARFDPELKYTVGIQDQTARLTTNPFTVAFCR